MSGTPSSGSGDPPTLRVESVHAAVERDSGQLANFVGLTWANRKEWMHRRVDSLTFVNAETVRVGIRFDLTIPHTAPEIGDPSRCRTVRLVPLTVLNKQELTQHFSLRDGSGQAVPRLHSETAAAIAGEMLVMLCGRVLEREHQRNNHDAGLPERTPSYVG